MDDESRSTASDTTAVMSIFALSWVVVMAATLAVSQILLNTINPDYPAEVSIGGLTFVALGVMLRSWLRWRNSVLLRTDRGPVSLWSNRWPLSMILIGLCAVTVSVFFFVQGFTHSDLLTTPLYNGGAKTRNALWALYSVLVAIDILAALALTRNADRVTLSQSGIRFSALWASDLAWAEISAIRLGQEWDGDVIQFDLTRRKPIKLFPPRKFAARARYTGDGHSLSIPENLVPTSLAVMVEALQKRCRRAATNLD